MTGLTKQSVIAAPAAVVLTELAERRVRRAFVLGIATVVPILVVFLSLNWTTDGGFFDATVRSLADEIFLHLGAAMALDLFLSNPVPLGLALLALVPWVLRDFTHRTLLLYAGTSMVILILTIGKPGSNVNYYIEPVAALCVAGSAGLACLERKSWRCHMTAVCALTACIVWAATLVVPPLEAFSEYKATQLNGPRTIELPEDPMNRAVLAPSPYVLLFEPRRTYYLNDDFTFSALAAWDKLLPAERITADLRSQRIGAVLVHQNVLAAGRPEPRFIGDWQGGWNFWSVAAFREALFDAYAPVDVRLPHQLLLFLPIERR
jgi:hypothetical protein